MNSSDLSFLARFAKTPEGQALLRILEARLASVNETLLGTDGNDVYRFQGRAKQLLELCKDITEAEQRLNRSTPANRPRHAL